MNRFALFCVIACFGSVPVSGSGADFKFSGQTLTVPDGFEVEMVAGPPFIERPVSMDFDEQGNLYVTISSGSNDNVQKQLEEKPHSIVRLKDTDGDGRFDEKTIFADGMMLPQGAMWFDGSLYVSAPPSIWKLTDTNNDGVADQREEWFQGKTLTGCANDLHGPHLGPDGWIYWCKGAFAEQNYEVNGKPFTTRASHIFRARPDGSRLESVLAGGMDNPVAIEFTPTGERLLVGTFFQQPEAGMRDGIIHAIYGGVYGKVNAVIDTHKKTGDLMPVMTHLGPSASCSIVQYRSSIWGSEFQQNLFVCNFNLHNVTRHVMEPDGASFRTRDETFLSSDNPDFHPTCVLEDADGSLLVIDTGGWYKLCCPTSQLWKPDVTGAIYRIRRNGARTVEDPRGQKINWEKLKPVKLAKYLDDERPRVVTRAIHQLAKRKRDAISALEQTLRKSKSDEARRNAVWALTQIDDPKARQAVYAAFPFGTTSVLRPDDTVAQAAIYSIGLWRDRNALYGSGDAFWASVAISNALDNSNHAMRRIAVEALGRIGDKAVGLRRLLKKDSLLKEPIGRALEHSVIYALIELNDAETTASALTNAATQRVALIALDQMDNATLRPEQITPFLNSTNAQLRETAFWIASRHSEWGAALAGFFRERLSQKNLSGSDPEDLPTQLAYFSRNEAIQELIAETLKTETTNKIFQVIALRAIARSGLKEAPANWTTELLRIFVANDGELIGEAVLAIRAVPPKEVNFSAALKNLAEDKSYPTEVRLNALAAVPAGETITSALFNFLKENIKPDRPVRNRSSAAEIFAKAKLTQEQLLSLMEVLKTSGPMETARLLSVFQKMPDEVVGLELVRTLKEAKAFSSLRLEQLKPLFATFPKLVQSQAEALFALLNVDGERQKAHLDALLGSLKDGDVRRGQAVFNSAKAACAACHAIGYAGGRLGPDLTKIGRIRNERDLLEAIVFPSASFVRSYEPIVVVTQSGDDFSGVLKTDAPDEIVIATGPGTEMKISRQDIEELRPGTLSIMPAGLDEQLSKQELADLIAFLKAAK